MTIIKRSFIFIATIMKILHLIFLIAFAFQSLGQTKVPSHQPFHALLQKHVNKEGKVNYRGLIGDSTALHRYLKSLSLNPPDEKKWTKNEQMAYWINAYNAFTIQLILKYYPLKSIKDIGSSIQVPFVNTPWDIKFILIGKERMDLNNIEHGILRKRFKDPRIHMALVCASKSCPRLLNESYEPSRLDQQLDAQSAAFLNDNSRNRISAQNAELSMIFKWYAADFNENDNSVMSFVNKHARVKLKPDTRITYLDYDWTLNE